MPEVAPGVNQSVCNNQKLAEGLFFSFKFFFYSIWAGGPAPELLPVRQFKYSLFTSGQNNKSGAYNYPACKNFQFKMRDPAGSRTF